MKIHIGHEIEKKFQESGLKVPFFAEKINKGERNVYSIFKRADINIEMLKKIGEVLNFDFLSLYKKDDHLVEDPQEHYGNKNADFINMSVTINISSHPNRIEKVTDFIKIVNETAQKMGFKIR